MGCGIFKTTIFKRGTDKEYLSSDTNNDRDFEKSSNQNN